MDAFVTKSPENPDPNPGSSDGTLTVGALAMSDIVLTPELTIATPYGGIANVGTAVAIGGVSITDLTPAPTLTVTVTLSATAGELTLTDYPDRPSGYAVTGSTISVTGAVDYVNTVLASLIDTVSGPDTVTIDASDSDGNTASEEQVAVVPPQPDIFAPSYVAVTAAAASPIPDVSIYEDGALTSETFDVSLTAAVGTLTLTGFPDQDPSYAISGSTLAFSGNLDYVNSVLASLSDTVTGPDTITIATSDGVGGVAFPDQIAVASVPSFGTIETSLPIILPDAHTSFYGYPYDTVPLSILNGGTASQTLTAYADSSTGQGFGYGGFSGLAAAATDTGDIQVGVDDTTDGPHQGSIIIGFVQDGGLSDANLVVNGDFENGTSGWVSDNPAVASGSNGIAAYSGSSYLSLGAQGSDADTSQVLATQPGDEYAISFWYYSSGQYPDDLNVSFGGTSILSLTDPAAAGWTEYTEDGYAVSSSTTLTIGGYNANGADGLDDVSVVAVSQELPFQTVQAQGTVFNLATLSVVSPTEVWLHVGDGGGTVEQALAIANTAANDGYSENLDASIDYYYSSGNYGDGVGTSGSAGGIIQGLAPGATDTTDLALPLTTTAAGFYYAYAEVAGVSDGTGIDSLGTTALGDSYTYVDYTVDNYATAAIAQVSLGNSFGQGVLTPAGTVYTLDLGLIVSGANDVLTGLNLANTAIGPADTLSAIVALTGDPAFVDTLTNNGTVSVVAGQSLTFDTVDLAANALGVVTETLTVAETGTNPGDFSQVLPTQTVIVTGTVVPNTSLANPVINSGSTIVLPAVHTGVSDTTTLSITNDTTADAPLLAGVGQLTGAAIGTGYIGGLAPGATDSTDITVGISTSTGGLRTGTVTLDFLSTSTFVSNVGYNLVQNGSFEQGLTGWTGGNGVETGSFNGITAHTGSSFLEFGAVGGDAFTDQTLATQIGTEYQISLWYWSVGRFTSDLNIYFGSDHVLSLVDVPATNGWVQYVVDAVATSSSTLLQIGGRNDPSYDGLDDVSVVSVGSSAAVVNLPQQSVTVEAPVYQEASPSFNATSYIYLHVGDGSGRIQEPITVLNNATANGYSENLDATVTGYSSGVITASGSVTDLAPGAADQTSMNETVFTGQAGYFYNYIDIQSYSDGTGIDNLGTTNLGVDYVSAYTYILNYATAAIVQAGTVGTLRGNSGTYIFDLGDIALNSATVVAVLGLANTASVASDGIYGQITGNGDPDIQLTGNTSFYDITAGQTASGIDLAVNTGTAGVFTATLTLTATASNPSGYSETLPSETVTVVGTVEQFIGNPLINTPSPVDFGPVRAGSTLTQALSVSNAAPTGSDSLNATATASGNASVTGSITGLAAGGPADTTDIVASLSALSPGFDTGTVTLAFASQLPDGSLQATVPPTKQVTLQATVYAEAQHAILFGSLPVLHTGDGGGSVSGSFSVENNAFSYDTEALIASISASSGSITVAPTIIGDIMPYQAVPVAYTVPTDQAGTVTGTVTVAFATDGTGTDGAPVTQIGTQVVTLAAAVFNYATAVVEEISGGGTLSGSGTIYTLNLGTVAQGDVPMLEDLALANAANPVSDLLLGTITASGDPEISFGGPYNFSGIGAQHSVDGIDLALNTGTTGAFSQTVTIVATDYNPGGYVGTPETLTVQVLGTVVPQPGFEVQEPAAAVFHVGDPGTGSIGIADTFPFDSGESLTATVLSAPGGVTIPGAIGPIVPSTTVALDYVIDTTNSGTVYGAVGLAFAATGSGSAQALGTLQVPLVASIYSYATAHVLANGFNVTNSGTDTVINLGTLMQGGTAATAQLAIANIASGLADRLSGVLTPLTNDGFIISGSAGFSQLRGGYADYVQNVSLDPLTGGTFTATFDLSSTGSDSSGYSGARPDQTVTIIGTVLEAQPPEIAAGTTAAVSRGAPSSVTFSLNDPDAYGGEQFTVHVSDTYGVLSATGSGVSGSGSTSLVISGSMSDVNAALASILDTDLNTANDQLSIAASDAFGNTSTASTDVQVLSLPPSLTAVPSVSLTEGTATNVNVGLAEPGDFIGNMVTATVSDSYDALSMTAPDGGTITTSPDPSVTVVGTGAQVDAALSTLSVTANSAASDTINISVSDGAGNTASTSISTTSAPASPPTGGVAPSLFYAILSMDAYFRQSDGSLSLGDPGNAGATLGGATFLDSPSYDNLGFQASAWSYNGKTVIAYRGTDELVDVVAWQQFLGSPYSTQGQEALQFYEDNNGGSLAYNPNIVLTGHSLGGGLAGWVSGITGAAAVPEDAIGYSLALINNYTDELEAYPAEYAAWLIFGGTKPVVPTPPNLGAAYGTYLFGEVATGTRVPYLDKASAVYTNAGINNPVTLHSASLLAIYTYAQNDSAWQPIGSYLFNGLTNSQVGYALKIDKVSDMDAEIAYSALQSGGTPFGTTGIAALFHDADTFAQFYQSPLTSTLNSSGVLNDLANMMVEWAGWLALNADTDSDNTGGILTLNQGVLHVDLSDDTWNIDGNTKPFIEGTIDLTSQLFTEVDSNDVLPDNYYLGTNNAAGGSFDLSSDTGTDMIYAGDGSVNFTLGTGTTYFNAGGGTDNVTVNQAGQELYFYGGMGSADVNASGLGSYETISIEDNGGAIQTEMGAKEDLLLANPNQFSTYLGMISGFQVGNDIDLANTSVSMAMWQNGALQADSITLQLTGMDYSQDLFDTETDGNGGTYIRIATLKITPSDPNYHTGDGPEQFTVQRFGDTSGTATVYISTEDPGGNNTGDFDPLSYMPVMFSAGSDTADFTLTIDDGDHSGQTKTFGLQATSTGDSTGTILATDDFSVTSPPPPPPPPGPPNGGGYGCPHFTTFDNLGFWFQGAGEFVAAESRVPGDTFQVQMRIEPEGAVDSSVSIITQIAVQVGADRVTFDPNRSLDNGFGSANPVFDPNDDQVVWVDGAPISFDPGNPVYTLPGGTITMVSQNDYRVVLNTGEVVTINPYGDGMGLDVALAPNAQPDSVQGFLGSYDGQANSFMLPDGTVLGPNLSQDELYHTFADAWRVTDATSLFDYASGQDTETFTNTQYPRQILTLADFPANLVAAAAALVAAAGITDPSLAQAAEFDYITMGDPGFIAEDALVASETTSGLGSPTPANITAPVAPDPSIGVMAESSTIVQAVSAVTTVSFDIDLTSAGTTDTTVEWGVIPGTGLNNGRTYFTAADFDGILPSGIATILAGSTIAVVTVDVPAGAVGSAVDKWLAISIDAPDGNPVYDPTAQTDIVNSAPVAGPAAVPTVSVLSAGTTQPTEYQPALTGIGNSLTLDLGQVLQGATISPIGLAIANAATAPADSLSGTISTSGGTGFYLYDTTLPGTIGAGSAYQRLQILPVVTQVGSNSETLTLTPYDVNQTGYSAPLAPITVTVEDTVIGPASPQLNTASLAFGNVRAGTTARAPISVSNLAAGTEASLDVAVTATGSAVANGAVSQLAAGGTDATDLTGGIDTSHAGVKSGAIEVSYFSDIGNGVSIPALISGLIGVTGTVYREAAAAATLANPIMHVGDSGSDVLLISNAVPADGFSENLIAALIGSSGGGTVTAGGPTGDIVAGGTNSSFAVSYDTSHGGTVTSQVTLAVTSDGTGIDGLGTIAETPATLTVTGTIFNYATAQIVDLTQGGPPVAQNGTAFDINLGQVALGSSAPSVTLGVENAASGPADVLAGRFVVGSGDSAITLSGFTPFSGVAAGATDGGLTVMLNTGSAGVFSQTITLAGTGSDPGFSGTLTPITILVEGTVSPSAAPAVATLDTPGPFLLGNQRVGELPALSDTLSFTNAATAAPAEALDVSIGSTTGSATANGSISLLQAGHTDGSSLSVGLDNGTAGAIGGSVVLDEFTDGTGVDQHGTALIGTATVSVSGAVYRPAAPSFSVPAETIVHRGDTGLLSIQTTNAAAADGYSEALIAAIAGASGGFSTGAAGPTADIAPGATDSALNVGFSTANAGTITGAITLDLTSDGGTGAGAIDGLGTLALAPQTITASVAVYNYATAALGDLSPSVATLSGSGDALLLNFGTVLAGTPGESVSLDVGNAATGPADGLSGSIVGGGSGPFSISSLFDTFTDIAPSGVDDGPSISLDTGTAGAFSQTITLLGTGANASGFSGTLDPIIVTITADIVGYATASPVTPNPVNFGNLHVGAAPTQALSVTNTAPTQATSEALDSSIGAATGAASTNAGSFSGLGAGATNSTSLVIGLNTGADGVQSGSAVVSLESDGTGIDGNGTTPLGSQTIAVTGTLFNYATAGATAAVDLGNARLGGPLTGTLTVTNTALDDAYSEALDATLGNATGAASASGTFSGLQASGSDNSDLLIGLNTGTVGVRTGSVTLTSTSDGNGIDGLGTTALGSQTIGVTGTVFREAAAGITAPATFLAHVGSVETLAIGVANTAAADGYSEQLLANVIGTSGSLSVASGSSGDISASGSTTLGVTVNTASAGIVAGDVTLGLYSDGAGIDGFGTIGIGTQTIAVSGTIYNYATAVVANIGSVGTLTGSGSSYVLNLGTLTQASARTQAVLQLDNSASGIADALTGSSAFSGSTTAFVNSGYGVIGSIAAGTGASPLDISLSTANLGTFTETATFVLASTDAGGSTTLVPLTVAVSGTVVAPSGQVYTLTQGETLTGAAGPNTLIATNGVLAASDSIDAGPTGNSTLVLSGGGTFNLTLPQTLTDIQTIDAQEGQPTNTTNGVVYPNTEQTVDLRAGMNNVTVDVAPPAATGNSAPPTITILGAANNDFIDLQNTTGSDSVTMGAGESALGGAGNDTFLVSAATIGDTINGGTGAAELYFIGGGTVTLGANITNIATLYLGKATTSYAATANGIAGLVVQDANTAYADTLTASGANQTLTGGGAGKLTMVGGTDTTFKDSASVLNGDTIRNLLAGDQIDITGLGFVPTGSGATALGFSTSGGNTVVTVNLGATAKTSFTVAGSMDQAGFALGTDTAGTGTLLRYNG